VKVKSGRVEIPASSEASHFDVLLLGPFALFRDGVPIDTAGWQRKVQSLFRLLALAPQGRRSRDELIDLLWPDASADAGARNLRVVLHMLRRGLGGGEPSPVLSELGWIVLNPAHEWDVDLARFESRIAGAGDDIAALQEAAEAYRGEPLMEERYEDWAIAVRSRVQRLWRESCLRLALLHREGGRPEMAVLWLDRVLEIDPLDEEAVVRMLETLAGLGRRTEALRRYQQFALRLKDDMDLAPSPETEGVVARIRKEAEYPVARAGAPRATEAATARHAVPIIPRSSLPVDGRLVGREPELGRILWTLPPLHVVAPRLAMVVSAPGMGKTRLLAEVAVRARRAGLLSLAGAAYACEGCLPFGPIRDALSDYLEDQPEDVIRGRLAETLTDLSRIVPELRWRFPDIDDPPGTTEDDRRLRLFLAVTRALDRIALDTPAVLLLDDLQWADESTLQALHFVVRRSMSSRLLIVAACSIEDQDAPPEAVSLAGELEQAGSATIIKLGPLPCQTMKLLLEERIRGRCTDSIVETLCVQSEGNPLRALQGLRALRDEGKLEYSPEGWRIVDTVPDP